MVEQVGSYETSTRVLWGCGTFLRENENHLAPPTTGQLLDIFNDASDAKELKLELAALVEWPAGKPMETWLCAISL